MLKLIIVSFLISVAICRSGVNHLTWSLENGTDVGNMEDAIALWKIKPLDFARVESGKGDVKIYFKYISDDNPLLGYAYPRDKGGSIFLKESLDKNIIFYVLQHEFGHVLGLPHNNNSDSVMFPIYNGKNVTDIERQKILEQYECRFDSVALINYQTYLVFSGSYYKRLDFNSLDTTRGQVWYPFITIVDTMYRISNGNYILISNKQFFEFNNHMKFIQQGFLKSLFPNVPYVDSVLKLRNGTTFVFSNFDVYKDDKKIFLNIFNYIDGSIRGVFELLDGSIQMIDRRHVLTFDKNFNYKNRSVLCETKYYSLIHCCD